MYLDTIKRRVQELHLLAQNVVWPCTPEEVERLEGWMQVTLPAAYKEYLFWMGHRAGSLFGDASCHYWNLEDNQKLAVEMLEEDMFPVSLPEDAFVFCIDQASRLYFFRLSEGENPPVYSYNETRKEPSFPLVYPSYSDYLATRVEEHASYLKHVDEHLEYLRNTGARKDEHEK